MRFLGQFRLRKRANMIDWLIDQVSIRKFLLQVTFEVNAVASGSYQLQSNVKVIFPVFKSDELLRIFPWRDRFIE